MPSGFLWEMRSCGVFVSTPWPPATSPAAPRRASAPLPIAYASPRHHLSHPGEVAPSRKRTKATRLDIFLSWPCFCSSEAIGVGSETPMYCQNTAFYHLFSFYFSFLIKVSQWELSEVEGTAQPDLLSHRPALLIPLRFCEPLSAFEAKHTIWAQWPDSPFSIE